jgi:CRISPR/Cas system-associated exonuclease Cas4 (RecB family)
MNEYHGMGANTMTVSKINSYMNCSMQYYFQYIEKVKAYSRSSLLFGSAFHSAEATNDTQKIESDVDLPVGDVCDVFSTQFDEGSHETLFMKDENKGELKDGGYSLIQCYHKVMTPDIHPKAVESRFELKLSNTDMVFAGKIDLITKDDQIIERKTKRAKPSNVDNQHKLQITAYSAGYQVTHKEKPKESQIHYAIMKKVPECLSYTVDVTDSDINFLTNMINLVKESVDKGVFIPNRSSFMCSSRYCQYTDLCIRKYGGVVKD